MSSSYNSSIGGSNRSNESNLDYLDNLNILINRDEMDLIPIKDHLINEEIREVQITPEKIVLKFDNTKLIIEAFNNCCSYSYFDKTDNLEKLVGQPFKEILFGYPEKKSDFDIHPMLINDIKLVMINESNGWYGGFIDVFELENHD